MAVRVFPIFYSVFHFWQRAVILLPKQVSTHNLFSWEKKKSTVDSSFSPIQMFFFSFWRARKDGNLDWWDPFFSHGDTNIDFNILVTYSWGYEPMRIAASEYLKKKKIPHKNQRNKKPWNKKTSTLKTLFWLQTFSSLCPFKRFRKKN